MERGRGLLAYRDETSYTTTTTTPTTNNDSCVYTMTQYLSGYLVSWKGGVAYWHIEMKQPILLQTMIHACIPWRNTYRDTLSHGKGRSLLAYRDETAKLLFSPKTPPIIHHPVVWVPSTLNPLRYTTRKFLKVSLFWSNVGELFLPKTQFNSGFIQP